MKDVLSRVFARLLELSDEEFELRLASVSDDPVTKVLNMFSDSSQDSPEWDIIEDFSLRSSDEIARFFKLRIEGFEEVNTFFAANDERFALAA